MRPLIRYDLEEPPTVPSASLQTGPHSSARRTPAKKRKRNHHNPQSAPLQQVPLQHWDDPGSAAVGVVYDEQEASLATGTVAASYADGLENEYGDDEDEDVDVEGVEEEEQSRPLTHEEIWDDSALIDAWNSAEAEYEAYHGTSRAWKTEPVKRSPLWYNKPYTEPGPSKPKSHSNHLSQSQAQEQEEDGEPGLDTAPLDFNTYVPTHDPSLAIASGTGSWLGPAAPATPAPFFVPPPSTTTISRDEAFNNALSAMYWSGYWTAVYHSQSQTSGQDNNGLAEATEGEIEAEKDEEDLVPAQR